MHLDQSDICVLITVHAFREACTETCKMANSGSQSDDFPPVEDWDIRLSISFSLRFFLMEGSICRHPPF